MSTTSATSYSNLNALSKLISNAGFQRLLEDESCRIYGKQMKKLLKKNGVVFQGKSTLKDIINISYNHLSANYRHEYLYKAALLNSYVLKNYSLSDTILLNEFKVGNSKADAVLVNGTNKVFEIKTELDSPERLSTQIADYYKVFSQVYLVVHHTLVEKYVSVVSAKVGIMVFNQNNIETFREAIPEHSALDGIAMIKALRKEEYLQLVYNLDGKIPLVPQVSLFKSCIEVLSNYASDEIQHEFMKIIKQRIKGTYNNLTDSGLPDVLRFSCYNSNYTQNDYIGLIKKLNYQF